MPPRQRRRELGISLRTYQRWTDKDEGVRDDGRKGSQRAAPANKLSDDERRQKIAPGFFMSTCST